jgi:hypothetical protein
VVVEVVHGVDAEDQVEAAVSVGPEVHEVADGEGGFRVLAGGHRDLHGGGVHPVHLAVVVQQQTGPPAGSAAEVDGPVAGTDHLGKPGSVETVGVSAAKVANRSASWS